MVMPLANDWSCPMSKPKAVSGTRFGLLIVLVANVFERFASGVVVAAETSARYGGAIAVPIEPRHETVLAGRHVTPARTLYRFVLELLNVTPLFGEECVMYVL